MNTQRNKLVFLGTEIFTVWNQIEDKPIHGRSRPALAVQALSELERKRTKVLTLYVYVYTYVYNILIRTTTTNVL